MTGRLLNLLTALSLLLCASVAALWIRSYFVHDILHVFTPGRWVILQCHSGGFGATANASVADKYLVTWESEPGEMGLAPGELSRFDYTSGPSFGTMLIFPLWTAVALFALPPLVRLALWRRRRRSAAPGFPVEATTAA
jgi:hypothetical protein